MSDESRIFTLLEQSEAVGWATLDALLTVIEVTVSASELNHEDFASIFEKQNKIALGKGNPAGAKVFEYLAAECRDPRRAAIRDVLEGHPGVSVDVVE